MWNIGCEIKTVDFSNLNSIKSKIMAIPKTNFKKDKIQGIINKLKQ